ncbi:MAG: tetratricopeptide repeat protein [Treponema sp.]|nr:tetratricopeptide repeat protein [Treponema sp.]
MKRDLFTLLLVLLSLSGSLCAQAGRGGPSAAAALYQEGCAAMVREEWYAAAESLLEALRQNPSHAEAAAALAECYYELSEFDQALSWVRKARTLARGNLSLANLEGRILVALGQLDAASRAVAEVLAREPYNREALFVQAEMDVARGRTGEAVTRYREAARRYPGDQKLLLSLALVLGSLGRYEEARGYIDRVLAQHSEDYRVYYYASYLASQADRLSDAIRHAERALFFRPPFDPAKSLLANLRYRQGQFDEAARLADELIAKKRDNPGAWYLKGMAFSRLGRRQEAVSVLSTAASLAPDDEFIRAALEDTLLAGTGPEDQARRRWASWHFAKARDFRARNLGDQALFEYRRGLRLNPYAVERRDYAEILRLRGFPARFMEELRFMQDLGLGDQGIDDAVETYTARLGGALYRRWDVDPLLVTKRHWKVGIFSLAPQPAFYHVDASAVAASYLNDLLSHDRNIAPLEGDSRRSSFSAAFRSAREAGADYFLVLTLTENERDLSLKGELFVGRTGSPAAVFTSYRTGPDRLRNASRNIIEQMDAALPFRGSLAARKAGQGLMDKGRADGVKADAVYHIVKRGGISVKNEGIGLVYAPADVIGTITIREADEEVAAGDLTRQGFYDRIEPGDELIPREEKTDQGNGSPAPAAGRTSAGDPELRALLRTLR